jgi:hypothetical protein
MPKRTMRDYKDKGSKGNGGNMYSQDVNAIGGNGITEKKFAKYPNGKFSEKRFGNSKK